MEDPKGACQFNGEGPARSIEAGGELLHGHGLIQTSSESSDHQRPLVGAKSLQARLEPGGETQHPEALETGPQVASNDKAMVGAAAGSTSLQEGDLLVGLEGDSTIESGFDLATSRWIELLEDRPHHVDAECQPTAELVRLQLRDRTGQMLFNPCDGGPEHRLADAPAKAVGPTKAGLDLVESTDRRDPWQHIDQPCGNARLEVHRRQDQGLGCIAGFAKRMNLLKERAASRLDRPSVHHVTRSEQNVLGISLIEGRQIDPAGAKSTQSIRTSLGSDPADRRRAASEALGELRGIKAPFDPLEHQPSLTSAHPAPHAPNGTSFTAMPSDQLPDGLVGTGALGSDLQCGLVERLPRGHEAPGSIEESTFLFGADTRETRCLMQSTRSAFPKGLEGSMQDSQSKLTICKPDLAEDQPVIAPSLHGPHRNPQRSGRLVHVQRTIGVLSGIDGCMFAGPLDEDRQIPSENTTLDGKGLLGTSVPGQAPEHELHRIA